MVTPPFPVDDSPVRQAYAEHLVDVALARIHEAQAIVSLASLALAPIKGLVGEYNAAFAHTDRLREFWLRLENKRNAGKFKLDRGVPEARSMQPSPAREVAGAELLRAVKAFMALRADIFPTVRGPRACAALEDLEAAIALADKAVGR